MAPHPCVYFEHILDLVGYFSKEDRKLRESEEVRMDFEEFRGKNRDEYDQNALFETLKYLI